MSDQLHVFSNDYDWVVAASAADAERVMIEMGSTDDLEEMEWSRCPDDATMHIWIDDVTGEVGDGRRGCTLINGDMATWAEAFGRGFLASTEF